MTTPARGGTEQGRGSVDCSREQVQLVAHRFRAAADHATRAFPDAIGEMLARELAAHAELGRVGDASGLLQRVIREVMALPVVRP
ncbi:hypothetical protein [Actinomycetospora sp.]|uniref:hypothetical protein n=1 Tax=Actinomycetospora sp. TaxID=1872135 RepID=UPI002F41035E